MSRSPAHLRAAAEALRALATALAADFDGLDHHSGPATWEGPAARAHRGRVAVAAFDARVVAVELRGLADRLDEHAAQPTPSPRPPDRTDRADRLAGADDRVPVVAGGPGHG